MMQRYALACLLLILLLGGPLVGQAQVMSPRVIHVPGDYSTVQQAVNTAQPGDTIQIAAGTYQENVIIDKPLTLRGTDREHVILGGGPGCRAGEEVLRLKASGLRVETLTVTQCAIGIGVRGAAALFDVRLTGNAIGIKAWDGGNATLRDSLIEQNTVGVEVWARAETSLYRSNVESNGVGLKALRGAATFITHSSIIQNDMGVEVWDSNQMLIEGSMISDNGRDGVWLHGPALARASLQNNVIRNNGRSGIRLGASPFRPDAIRADITRNTIQGNGGCGVWTDQDPGIKVTGQGNGLQDNAGGDLCPAEYPWPSGF